MCGGTPTTYPMEQPTLIGYNCLSCGQFVTAGSPHICGAPGYGTVSTPTKAPHKCPACDGWGKRPSSIPDGTPPGTNYPDVECPACDGKGVVWEP